MLDEDYRRLVDEVADVAAHVGPGVRVPVAGPEQIAILGLFDRGAHHEGLEVRAVINAATGDVVERFRTSFS